MPNFEGRREKDEICVNSQETQITRNLLGIPTTPAAEELPTRESPTPLLYLYLRTLLSHKFRINK